MWVHTILTLSHILALPGIYLSYNTRYYTQDYVDLFVKLIITLNSILMHISETKHQLKPDFIFLKEWSNIFLNMDRLSAVLGFMYFFYFRFYPYVMDWGFYNLRSEFSVYHFFSILPFLLIGEYTNNLYIYVICHIVWHTVFLQFLLW